jgi:hypothetical protein
MGGETSLSVKFAEFTDKKTKQYIEALSFLCV